MYCASYPCFPVSRRKESWGDAAHRTTHDDAERTTVDPLSHRRFEAPKEAVELLLKTKISTTCCGFVSLMTRVATRPDAVIRVVLSANSGQRGTLREERSAPVCPSARRHAALCFGFVNLPSGQFLILFQVFCVTFNLTCCRTLIKIWVGVVE